MSVNYTVDEERKLLITRWIGKASDLDVIVSIKLYLYEILSKEKYSDYNEVVMLPEATTTTLANKTIKELALQTGRIDAYRINSRLAIVASSDLVYKMAKKYATYRNSIGKRKKDIRLFRSANEAIVWAQTD